MKVTVKCVLDKDFLLKRQKIKNIKREIPKDYSIEFKKLEILYEIYTRSTCFVFGDEGVLNKYMETKNTTEIRLLETEMLLDLYILLEDKNYIQTAYNIITEKAALLSEDLKNDFLNRYFPKMILEEYNKVFKK